MSEEEKKSLESLSKPAQRLAISMCHFTQSGGRINAIEATAEIGEKFGTALEELLERNMVQRGFWEVVGHTTQEDWLKKYPNADPEKFVARPIRVFREDKEEGNRYRLEDLAKSTIMKKVFPPDGLPKY